MVTTVTAEENEAVRCCACEAAYVSNSMLHTNDPTNQQDTEEVEYREEC